MRAIAGEEVGQPYAVRLVSFRVVKQPAYRALHAFGKFPTLRERRSALLETGAMVLHIGTRRLSLLSVGANERAHSSGGAADH
jgi:glutathione S-transferase